ncbi:hypothetical protein [Rathayibacter sp. VKM Ac-2927]|uniref:hypothetical protein n=1 Tax=Rathayibacter sp. VKM Ac-2927 TaxID=2929478 RepID=UPI001FB1D897|nr:hypothetical protein [Rathayibacter sp. VKM Ac-2927]MCJ1688524.1 hypothetical protein [Rathayibacter sp. VKM Ac-2927]
MMGIATISLLPDAIPTSSLSPTTSIATGALTGEDLLDREGRETWGRELRLDDGPPAKSLR